MMIYAKFNEIQCCATIASDEPVFLLQAKDMISPSVVRAWAELNFIAGGDPEHSRMALKHAQLTEEWQLNNGYRLTRF